MRWDSTERYRQMVDPSTDYILQSWGDWMVSANNVVSRGYPPCSAGFDNRSLSDFDDLEEGVEVYIGRAATEVIYSKRYLPAHRAALTQVYAKGKGLPRDEDFLAAIASFERGASTIGLL